MAIILTATGPGMALVGGLAELRTDRKQTSLTRKKEGDLFPWSGITLGGIV